MPNLVTKHESVFKAIVTLNENLHKFPKLADR